MNRTRAEALLLMLRAAFATPEWDQASRDLYLAELCRLDDEKAAEQAIRLVIRHATFRPTIAEILTEYGPLARRNRETNAEEHGLPLPELTEDERRANLARVRELQKRIEKAQGTMQRLNEKIEERL